MSESQRNKGNRIEREIVNWFKRIIGIYAERVPLSGASRYQGEGHDINVYLWGTEAKPLVCEVKARKEGAGFTLLRRWLGKHDALFLHEDRQEDLVVMPCRVLAEIFEGRDRTINIRPEHKSERAVPTSRRPDTRARMSQGEGKEHSYVDSAKP